MKKQLLFFALLGLGHFTFGQEDSTRTIELSNITIHENRFEIPFPEASRNISITTAQDIRRAPARSIPGILSYVPGVDIRQRGPFGAQADIGIRGGSFEQTLVLVNGVKMSDPQTGHHALSLPIPVESIDRIEVLKGPAARVFGQNAFSGAVNFITKIPEEKSLRMGAYAGDFGLYGLSTSLALPGSKFKQYISLSREASNGYRHNTDFETNNVFYQAEIAALGGEFNLLGGITDRKFGANGFYANPTFTEQYEEVTTAMASVSYHGHAGAFTLKPRLYWRNNHDDYLFFRSAPSEYRNDHFTNVFGFEVNSSVENPLGETGFGIETRTERISGDWEREGVSSKSNLDGFHREKIGIYIEHKFKALNNKLHITPGVFVNSYTDFGLNSFPGIDIGYSLAPELRIYGNVGSSYRVPTFYDQYYESAVERGNPDLQPETAVSYEGGIRFLKRGAAVEINYFNFNADQLIDWALDESGVWNAMNITDVATQGVETSVDIDFSQWTGADFPVYRLFMSYNFIDSNLKNTENTNTRYTLENLRDQLIIGVDHKLIWQIDHALRARMIKRVDEPHYWLLDAKVYWNAPAFQVFVEGSNLTNTEYSEVMTPMPGRWVRGGITYKLKLR